MYLFISINSPVFLVLIKVIIGNSEVQVSDAMDQLGPDGTVLAKHEAVPCDSTELCVESPSACVVGAWDHQVTDAESVDCITINYNVPLDGFTRYFTMFRLLDKLDIVLTFISYTLIDCDIKKDDDLIGNWHFPYNGTK